MCLMYRYRIRRKDGKGFITDSVKGFCPTVKGYKISDGVKGIKKIE